MAFKECQREDASARKTPWTTSAPMPSSMAANVVQECKVVQTSSNRTTLKVQATVADTAIAHNTNQHLILLQTPPRFTAKGSLYLVLSLYYARLALEGSRLNILFDSCHTICNLCIGGFACILHAACVLAHL